MTEKETKDIQTQIHEVEITHPTTGEILAFKGRVVDVGLALRILSDQVRLHRDIVKHLLGIDAYEQFKAHPEESMTRHYEGELGLATVQIRRDPEFSPDDIRQLRELLDEDTFNSMFRVKVEYRPMMVFLKTFLRTTRASADAQEAKRIIREKMDLAKVDYIVKYQEKKAAREDYELEEGRAKEE